MLNGWSKFAAAPDPGLDDWCMRNLGVLVELEALAPAAVEGRSLVHLDTRADNILLTDDRVYVVDWPHACIGAAWVEFVGFAPSVAMQGGPAPEDLMRRFPSVVGTAPEAVTAVVAALAGYFTWQAQQPPPPGLPTVRAFQDSQGAIARRWLAERTGLS